MDEVVVLVVFVGGVVFRRGGVPITEGAWW